MSGKNNHNRRDFLKGAAAGVGAVALSGTYAASAAAQPIPAKWDEETDVLVIGYGGAGACAAIEAHDAGAKVLILEKQPQDRHYPNTRMSGGIYHCPDAGGDPAALKAYAKAMFSGENIPWKLEGEQPEVSDGLADAWVKYSPQNFKFLQSLDPEFQMAARDEGSSRGAAFPDFPGAKESGYRAVFSSYTGRSDPNVATKHLPKNQKMNGEALFACMCNGVNTRKIRALFNTPAKKLIKNDKGEIIGAIALKDGKEIAIAAKRAVVITSGGYEYNKAMRQAFLEGPGVEGWAFYGTTANEGDGIEMAMAAGAGLMKVGKAASRLIAAVPQRHNGMKIGLITDSMGTPGTVVVDNYGKRYMSEVWITRDPSRYFSYKEAVKFDIQTLDYPRSPSWMIFDETVRARRAITGMGISTAGYDFIPWSADNMDAINRGWILKGNTFAELAEKIKAHPDNRKLMDVATFDATMKRFNQFAEKGVDEDFKRSKATMLVLDKPPYYAIPAYAGGPNTKGGLAANATREVLDWQGKPIPRLYTAGEISSALKFVYQGGGNLTECIVFGRIAGMSAAKLTPWS